MLYEVITGRGESDAEWQCAEWQQHHDDYNGVEKASHIRDKLVEMTHQNETIYSTGIASSYQSHVITSYSIHYTKLYDPQTGELRALKIDERYIKNVEERLGLKTDEQRASFRNSIRKIYGQKLSVDANYDFMDNLELVKAVTDVRLKSDIAGAGSLIGALANRTNEET